MPDPQLPVLMLGCFATCSAYAGLLSTRRGRAFTLRHTWVTVVAGVGIVLGFLALWDATAAAVTFALFAAGGLPLVLRSWWLEQRYQRSYIEYLRSERHTPPEDD